MRRHARAALAQIERWLAALRSIDPATLSPAVRADWAMLENDFLSERWWLTELRAWQWNPSLYNVAEPFALLLSLEYAPLEERLRTFLARLANVPAYYAAAKGSIASPTVEHTQLAIEQNRGALDVFGAALENAIGDGGTSAGRAHGVRRRVSRPREPRSRTTSVGSKRWKRSS